MLEFDESREFRGMERIFALLDLGDGIEQLHHAAGAHQSLGEGHGHARQGADRTQHHAHVAVEGHEFADGHGAVLDEHDPGADGGEIGEKREHVADGPQTHVVHRDPHLHVHDGAHVLEEAQALGVFPGEGLDHLDAGQGFGKVGGNLGKFFLNNHGVLADHLAEVVEIQVVERQREQHQERHLPVDEHEEHDDEEQLKELFPELGHDVHQHVEERHVRNDVGDQFPRTVLLVEPERQTLQMAEDLLPQVHDEPDPGVGHQIVGNVPQQTAHQIDDDHGAEKHPEEQVIGVGQHPVDGDLEHPRERQAHHVEEDQRDHRRNEKPFVGPDEGKYLVQRLFLVALGESFLVNIDLSSHFCSGI